MIILRYYKLQCSRSCNGGVKVRHASCQDAAGREVPLSMCDSKEKHDWEKCNEQICTQWRFGPWGNCSVTCGYGIETRDARCTDLSGRNLDESEFRFITFQGKVMNCDERFGVILLYCIVAMYNRTVSADGGYFIEKTGSTYFIENFSALQMEIDIVLIFSLFIRSF